MERTFMATSSGKISYLHRAGRFNLIFLHGLGGSSNNWMKLGNNLDDRFSLYFVDLLGHGGTEARDWNYTIEGQCRMLSEFIDGSGIDKYGLIGNSYGGWISATFATKFGKPDYLVLEDSAGVNPTVGEWEQSRIEEFIDRLQSFGRPNDRGVMESIIRQNSTGAEKLSEQGLQKITSETMIIWGERDRMIDISYGRKMNEFIPGSRFSVIENAGHIPHYTHAEEVAELINGFIPIKSI